MAILFFFSFIYLAYGLFFLITIVRTIGKGERGGNPYVNFAMTLTEIIFTVVGPLIGFMRFDAYGPEIPFAKQHVLTVILFVIIASLSFWVARFTSKTNNPFLRIFVSVGLLQGIILCAITTVHFLAFIPLGVIYPILGFELLSPVFALFLLLREFYFYNRVRFNYDDALPYRKELGFIPAHFRIMEAPISGRLVIYGLMLLPFIVLQVMLAYGCGQDIDSIVKAFTHSIGFVLSR